VTSSVWPNQAFGAVAGGQRVGNAGRTLNVAVSPFHAGATAGDIDPVIDLEGEFDATSSDWFGACFAAVLARHPTSIAIDARGLSFMDSSGLRSMLIARGAAEDAGVPFGHPAVAGRSPSGRAHRHPGASGCPAPGRVSGAGALRLSG
jgi:hypothetical protein